MTDKIVNIQSATITGSEPTYTPVNAEVSTISVSATSQTPEILATEDIQGIDVQLSGMGEESVPNDSLFKRNQDFADATDQPRITTGKLFIDLVTKTDTVTLLANYKRTFTETKSTVELKSFAIGKNLVEVKTLQENFKKQVQKQFNDTVSKLDQNTKLVTKNLQELKVFSDLVSLLATKNTQDSIATSDVLSAEIDYVRIFVDSVDATDDFLGEANIDDDQTARVGKNVIDYITSSDINSLYLSSVKQDQATTLDQKAVSLTKVLLDSKILSDVIKLAYSKTASDTVNKSDVFLLSLNKALLEYTSTQETITKQVAKAYVDATTNQEQVAKSATKVLEYNQILTDVLSNTFGKIVADLVSSVDVVGKQISPAKVEQVNTSEQQYSIFGKQLLESQVITEVFSTVVNYNRTYTDSVDATDDFLGEANVDDDQVARVGKNVLEYVSFPETVVFAASKQLQDTATSLDSATKSSGKTLSDQIQNTDIINKSTNKNLTDTLAATDPFIRVVSYNRIPTEIVNSSEQTAIDTSKVLADISSTLDILSRIVDYNRTFTEPVTSSDIKYFNIQKVYLDTANSVDIKQLAVNKTLLDQTTNSEVFDRAVSYNRTYTDAVDATDDFFGEANVDDDQIARVGKVLTDTPITLETVTTAASKTVQDLASMQEAAAKAISKPFTDQSTSTDQLYKTPTKAQIDSVIAADIFSFNKTTNLPLLDTITHSDSGIINNQSYFAGTFATPGYVGTNTYFT